MNTKKVVKNKQNEVETFKHFISPPQFLQMKQLFGCKSLKYTFKRDIKINSGSNVTRS